MRRDLPSGTVTFLFSDVEGSTRLLHELGAEAYVDALAEHRRVIREACASHGGVEVDTQGDAFFFAFPTAPGGLAAAQRMTELFAAGRIQVRVGLHTGTPLLTEEGYVGGDVHRAARIAAAGHGGQVVVSAATAQLVEQALTDLGEHRLKDLSAPERIYQLGHDSFPALKSLFRTNLPVPTTPFLGRERELADVVGLLGSTRLLTLTGPGGTGKTRLAAQAAALAADGYPDGVWWISLAALRDPTLVLETAAQVVGSKNGLAEHIADKAMLCLFDNFEQVVGAAPDVAALLADCPNLGVLVTSREPLHLTGEQEYAVPPLAHEEGVGFFLARARAVKPEFASDDTVSEICVRLDDLPLALELAAARVKALSAVQILERLDERLPLLTGGARDLPERQRTLRATIAWSYDLLSADEQQLFARLAVFRGGCTLGAAEDVCDAHLDTLQSLVDKSLLRFTSERYWMLETIREYATEHLEESGEAEELRRRHAEWFVALAESAPRDIPVSRDWLDEMEAEHDNLRAALDAFAAAGESQLALRLAGTVWRFWSMRGYVIEAWHRLDRVLQDDDRPTTARANALNGAAWIATTRGDPATAAQLGDEALKLWRHFGDAWGTAYSTYLLGHAAADASDWTTAQQRFEDSLLAFRELGAMYAEYALAAADVLALAYRKLGHRERALELAEHNLVDARAARDRRSEATALGALGLYAVEDGRVRDAISLLVESTRLWREVVDVEVWDEVVLNVCSFARVFALEGRPRVATRLVSAAMALHEEIGAIPPRYMADVNEGTLAILHEQVDRADFAEAWEQGRSLSLDDAVALALASID